MKRPLQHLTSKRPGFAPGGLYCDSFPRESRNADWDWFDRAFK